MNSEGKFDIMVVDDEEQIRRLVRLTLEESGFGVREAYSGTIFLGEAAVHTPDLVILDLGLPDVPGSEVLRALRMFSSVPVLVLTVLSDEANRIQALEAGADDYITKPFSTGELIARIRAILRRARPSGTSVFNFGPIEVDLEKGRVLKAGRQVKLTAMEFKLLRMLVINRDKVLTHQNILSSIWGPKAIDHTNYLRIYMMHLRRKLGEDVESAGHFQTESGVGYRFVSEPLKGA
ncbi:MAG TPA: response regulator [Opitutaceae bacterium]|jgi:two-component system KDP operon response regulator KdpE